MQLQLYRNVNLKLLCEMSVSVEDLGSGLQPPDLASSEKVNKDVSKRDQLGDLVEKMDSVKIGKGRVDPEKMIKHPLQNAWTLWFFKNDKARTWEENQRPIITVTTVE